jgi:two-component system LytT family sensor kinase
VTVAISVTVAALLGVGFAALVDLATGSIGTLLIVAAFVNVGVYVGRRVVSMTRGGDAGSQRKVVTLVEQTLPHMRLGLTEETAHRTVNLLHDVMRLEAVGLTDQEHLLAFVGPGSDHHRPGDPIRSPLTRKAIEANELMVADHPWDLDCDAARNGGCPLKSVVVAPLAYGAHSMGALKVYQTVEGPPDPNVIELTRGLAGMLSLQLELAQAEREAQLAEAAKLDALRAQINPHFLFNTLNTISMRARTDPEEARRLLVRLSDFLRYAMKHSGHLAPFGEEYFFVRTYLFLEKARYGERLKVRYDVDPQCLSLPVPVLTIQPLIENAVKHGIATRPGGGLVELKARLEPIGGVLRIKVTDNGVGIDPEKLSALLSVGTQVSALANIYERLVRIYGGRASFDVSSTPGKGTSVSLSLPVGVN